MMNPTPPTPYPDVNVVLFELLSDVQTILERDLVGMYLFGSLASGGFDQYSDIDVVVVTADEISTEQFSALQAMHRRIAGTDSLWATQLEVSYIPRHVIRRHDPTDALHPHLDRGKGEQLQMMQHDSDWVVQRYTLRERGIPVVGPPAHTLIDPVSPNELRQAMVAILHGWATQILDDPAHMNSRGYQSYTVLSLCRILYTLQHGATISKRAAAQWAQDILGGQWVTLIERAWEGRQTPDLPPQPEDVNRTLDLIRYTLERSKRFEEPTGEG